MIFKELKSNKGSTLGLVLITLSVLSLLGVTLISVGLASYKIRMTEERIKTSFYMAESGLEQAYGIILEAVGEAVAAANDAVNAEIETFIEQQREAIRVSIDGGNPLESNYIHKTCPDYGTIDPNGEINPDGPVNEEAINNVKNNVNDPYGWLETFQDIFTAHINDPDAVVAGDELHLRLVDLDKYDPVPPVSDSPVVILAGPSHIPFPYPSDPNSLDSYSITLQSYFDFEGTTQTVQMKFVINEPDEIIAGDFTETHVVQIRKSPIWDNALVADNNIIISGGDVTIRGDVYANATLPADSYGWDVNSVDFGGIVIGDNSAGVEVDNSSVEIEGDVFTNSFVQIRSDSSSLEVEGDTFANSLVLQWDTNNSSITLTGDLYTFDDIELNGTQATINITRNFYGFSAFGIRHDQTSSIVINSPDIVSGGSSINIAGNTYLAGVAHVELTNILYQTGESVSIRGNFKAYSVPLDRSLHWYDPFALIYKGLLVPEKSAHFLLVNSKYPGFLDAPSAINFGTMKFSEGAFIDDDAVHPSHIPLEEGDYLAVKAGEFTTNLTNQETYSRIFTDNPEIIESLNTENEIVYITASDVAIIGNDEHGDVGTSIGSTNETIMPAGQTVLTGIVVTDGNVYIRGNITFRGLIAAKGNIYIEDNHPKLFRTDLGFILRKVHENPAIAAVFIPAVPAETLTFTALSQAGAADPETLAQYKGLIEVRSWERIN